MRQQLGAAPSLTYDDVTKTYVDSADATKVSNLVATGVKTSAYTAVVNDLIPVDCTSGAVTITLPTAPADKSRIAIKKVDASTNIVTINRGGSTDVFNVAGGSTSMSLSLQYQAVVLQYVSATAIWYVTSTDVPLGGLDARYLNRNTTGTAAGISGLATPTVGGTLLSEQYITTFNTTLASSISYQPLFSWIGSGALAVVPGVYFFEVFFFLTGIASSAGNVVVFNLSTSGTATYHVEGTKGSTAMTDGSNVSFQAINPTGANSVGVSSGNAGTDCWARLSGILLQASSGSVIPQVALPTTATTTVQVAWFRIWQVATGTGGNTYSGAWS